MTGGPDSKQLLRWARVLWPFRERVRSATETVVVALRNGVLALIRPVPCLRRAYPMLNPLARRPALGGDALDCVRREAGGLEGCHSRAHSVDVIVMTRREVETDFNGSFQRQAGEVVCAWIIFS